MKLIFGIRPPSPQFCRYGTLKGSDMGGAIKSRYRGVCWEKKKKCWRVQVTSTRPSDGKQFCYLQAYYDAGDEAAAARAYDAASLHLHGRCVRARAGPSAGLSGN